MGYEYTIPRMIQAWAKSHTYNVALRQLKDNGNWEDTTWKAYWRTLRQVGRGLMALGHRHGEPVAIVGNNRREWVLCQAGIIAAGGMPAPIYTTNSVEQVAYIVNHCQARIAICDDRTQLDKYRKARAGGLIPRVEHFVTMDELGDDAADVITLDALIERASEVSESGLDARIDALEADDIGMFIYTSGTTGVPKCAQYSHANMYSMGQSFAKAFPMVMTPEEFRYISYLPLCHSAEQMFTNFMALAAGGTVHFCPEIAAIKDYLVKSRPTIFFAVPRVWEKFEAALRVKLGAATGVKAKLATWALRTELQAAQQSMQLRQPVDTWQRRLANKLVISKIKEALGLDQVVVVGAGAAPTSRSTLDFFASIGLLLHEGYGMTETAGGATASPLGQCKFGCVGKALPDVTIAIADDGEVLLKGPNMIGGYRDMPEETAALLDEDGWLHTGDIGELDSEGYLKITGRKKDLIITAGGKNVAPTELEGYIKGIPGVGHAVVVGDRQPYLCALVALEEEALDDLCAAAGVARGRTVEELARDPQVRAFLDKRIAEDCNARVARYQTIKKFEILPVTFSVDSGELTPTMKLRRNVVSERYGDVIDGLYSS